MERVPLRTHAELSIHRYCGRAPPACPREAVINVPVRTMKVDAQPVPMILSELSSFI